MQKLYFPAETEVVVAAKTETHLNPETGKYEEVEVEPERREKITLPAGTKFGAHAVGVPFEVKNAEEAKPYLARGAQKVESDAKEKRLEKAAAEGGDVTAANDAVAERDREVALQSSANAGLRENPTAGGKE